MQQLKSQKTWSCRPICTSPQDWLSGSKQEVGICFKILQCRRVSWSGSHFQSRKDRLCTDAASAFSMASSSTKRPSTTRTKAVIGSPEQICLIDQIQVISNRSKISVTMTWHISSCFKIFFALYKMVFKMQHTPTSIPHGYIYGLSTYLWKIYYLNIIHKTFKSEETPAWQQSTKKAALNWFVPQYLTTPASEKGMGSNTLSYIHKVYVTGCYRMRSRDIVSMKSCHSLAEPLPEMPWRASAKRKTLHLTPPAPQISTQSSVGNTS